jgi:galactokinase
MSGAAASSRFVGAFGRAPDVLAHAPGRVNLIGEHTDYNDGFVLPMAIPQATFVALGRTRDRRVRAVSQDFDGHTVTFELGVEEKTGGWGDYVAGTVVALRRAGHEVEGFDVAFSSDVPMGAGLSSSAALEIALLRALREVFALDVDDVALAKIGRAAETDFVGAPIGIMDQMASSLAGPGDALFIDTRDLSYERLALPPAAEVVVIDSGVTHDHATGDYATRREECRRAAELLGVAALRDASSLEPPLPEPLRRRARHVITENARVLAAVACLRSGDAVELGKLLDASHESLRRDFEVSVDEVDRLVDLAQRDPDCLGARMTGGGFGGAIIALARRGSGAGVARRVADAYGAHGTRGRVLVPLR